MVKLKNPLLSLGAVGRLTKAITFTRRNKVNIVEKTPTLVDVKSDAQLTWRTMFQLARDLWHELSAAEKIAWEAAGTIRHMTGYAWFISQALRPNPGLYLPLLGGTMQGEIAMAGNKVSGLPDPDAGQDAATKAYIDTTISNLAWAEFFNNTPSGIGAYYEMSPNPTEDAKSTFTAGPLGTGDNQALFQWISDAVVSFTTILAGVISVHIHAQRTIGNKSIRLYAQLYEYTAAAAEILIATTEISGLLTDDETSNEIHAPLAADYDIAPTSKLLIKFLANVGAGGANVTLNLYAEGVTTSSVFLPTPTSPLIDAAIDFHASIADAHHAPPDIGEGHENIVGINYESIGQGTWMFQAQPDQWARHQFVNTSHDDGDNISYKIFLSAGTYTIRMLYSQSNNRGVADIDIDGAEVASFDQYDAATVLNKVISQTGINIAASGLKTLRIRADGKDPASTDHFVTLSLLTLWRTA